jgi:hypothetical protein
VDLRVPADQVWKLIGGFGPLPDWLPYIPTPELGEGGRTRRLANPDGSAIVERLMALPDGLTWRQYEQNLEGKLVDLHARVHRGAYRALPSRRKFIPKADGRERPLGIAALEDKIVQRAVVEVFNAIYEEDFLGFLYGFRPRRS